MYRFSNQYILELTLLNDIKVFGIQASRETQDERVSQR